MIEIKQDDYYVGIWFLAGEGRDWMCVVWRTAAGACEFSYRFRYYADPDEEAGFNPFDDRDKKSFWKGRWDDKTEDEVIKMIDGLVDHIIHEGFCGTRLPWKVRDRRFKNLCRGDGEAFRKLMMALPYTHITTEDGYKQANADMAGKKGPQ